MFATASESILAPAPAAQAPTLSDLAHLETVITVAGVAWAHALSDLHAARTTDHRTMRLQRKAELEAERHAALAQLAYLDARLAFERAAELREVGRGE